MTLSIGDVSKLLGISPGILRSWEREQLVAPARTDGSHRVYGGDDVRRLRQVARLYFEEKLNPAAIRRELGVTKAPRQHESYIDKGLGEKLRSLRQERRMTLVETAKRASLSTSFISALERGNTGVSLDALFQLCEALGTTLPSLKGEALPPARRRYVPADRRQRFSTDDNLVVLEDIIARPAAMEAQIATLAPGADSGVFYAHKGQEFVHVLAGELSIWLEPDEAYVLKPGDTLYLHSDIKHRWANQGDEPVRAIWVNAALPVGTPGRSRSEPQESRHAGLAVSKD